MKDIYLESEGDKVAVIAGYNELGQSQKMATIFLLSDGWHVKSAGLHTRHAWSGPFASPTEALAHFAESASATA